MRVVAIVQARVGSSRLPGKSLLQLAGKPMLAHVLERASAIGVDEVLLATSDQDRDLALISVAYPRGIGVYTGSEHDVLGRMAAAATWTSADVVMRLTGDCPFLSPETCAYALEQFHEAHVDYLSNDTTCSGYPDGLDVEIFSRAALTAATEKATQQADREHVTPWMRRELRSKTMTCPFGDFRTIKLSVDRPSDFTYAQALHRYLLPGELAFSDTLRAVEAVRLEGV